MPLALVALAALAVLCHSTRAVAIVDDGVVVSHSRGCGETPPVEPGAPHRFSFEAGDNTQPNGLAFRSYCK